MIGIIIGLIILCLLAGSCDEWRAIPSHESRAVPIETNVDQSEESVALSGGSQQNYISVARVRFAGDALIPRSMVHITLTDGKSKWQFDADSEVQTMMSGVLTMDFTIKAADGAIVSQGKMSWPLKPDCRLSIDIERSSHDPKDRCWGCSGSRSFPIVNPKYKTSAHDAIFVVWGGNSISNPAHY